MFGHPNEDGTWTWPAMDLVRLAIPRRVYTQSHMDYVLEVAVQVVEKRDSLRGFRIVQEAPHLRHFTAKLKPLP